MRNLREHIPMFSETSHLCSEQAASFYRRLEQGLAPNQRKFLFWVKIFLIWEGGEVSPKATPKRLKIFTTVPVQFLQSRAPP